MRSGEGGAFGPDDSWVLLSVLLCGRITNTIYRYAVTEYLKTG